ncbi:MAG: hypothetical protein ABJL99_27075 [Aliishimia sp.]
MRRTTYTPWAATGLVACAIALPGALFAQDAPNLRFGVTTGFVASDNRGLDDPSLGSTFEAFSRVDFGVTFATPSQQLEVTGDITLRGLNGAEEGSISDGLVDPNLRLSYGRQARNAQLSFDVFIQQSETNTLVAELDGSDVSLINDDATRLRYGFDTELELGRQSPFGVTFSTGFTALEYSDTTSTTLTDQDRYRVGARFRFDINPALQAILNARLSTFEDEGTAEGRRDTVSLDGSLRQTLPAGSFGLNANITSVEEGERYTLTVERSIERPLWEVGGSLGLAQSLDGDVFPIGTLDVTHTLQNGSLSLDLSRSIRSGINDNEQEATSVSVTYAQQLNDVSSFNMGLSYFENDPTDTTGTSSLGTISLGYQRTLAPGWQMNVGINRRINETSAGIKARDNNLSFSVRRDLTARR